MSTMTPRRPCPHRVSRGATIASTLLAAALLAGAAAHASEAPPPASGTPTTADGVAPLDLNAATEEQLSRLPRVGPVIARRIVEHRRAVGGFRSVDELLNVRGIGERTLERLRPLLTVSRVDGDRSRSPRS